MEWVPAEKHENWPGSYVPTGLGFVFVRYPGVSPRAIFVRSLRELQEVLSLDSAVGKQSSGQSGMERGSTRNDENATADPSLRSG